MRYRRPPWGFARLPCPALGDTPRLVLYLPPESRLHRDLIRTRNMHRTTLERKIKERKDVLANAAIQLKDVTKELKGAGAPPGVVDRLKNILGTIRGLRATLDELKN